MPPMLMNPLRGAGRNGPPPGAGGPPPGGLGPKGPPMPPPPPEPGAGDESARLDRIEGALTALSQAIASGQTDGVDQQVASMLGPKPSPMSMTDNGAGSPPPM